MTALRLLWNCPTTSLKQNALKLLWNHSDLRVTIRLSLMLLVLLVLSYCCSETGNREGSLTWFADHSGRIERPNKDGSSRLSTSVQSWAAIVVWKYECDRNELFFTCYFPAFFFFAVFGVVAAVLVVTWRKIKKKRVTCIQSIVNMRNEAAAATLMAR